MRSLIRFLLVSSALALFACGGDSSSEADAAVDLGPDLSLPQSAIYEPCVEDSQCPGEGAVCRKNTDGWPGGYCTVPCSDRTVCGDGVSYNFCLARSDGSGSFCERKCLNGLDCARDGYTCTDIDAFAPASGGRCIGFCTNDEVCGEGAVCDTYTGECKAASEPLSEGAAVGDPCTADAECRSSDRTDRPVVACIVEQSASGASGFIDGYCLTACVLPTGYNSNTFYSGETLPTGSCPTGDICYPNGSLTEGDIGICLKECSQTSDCRDGYECRTSVQLRTGPQLYDNGVCMPVNCASAACPSGFSCSIQSNGAGVCVRN